MMSGRTPYRSPSLTRPIAMPATCALSGTPASIRASDAPHTEAIEDEPFDSRMSETTRIVYGNSSFDGSTASPARSASAPGPPPPPGDPPAPPPAPRLLRGGAARGGEPVGGEAPDAPEELGVAAGLG